MLLCVCVGGECLQLMIGDARGDADGATIHVQSRRSVIDWTSLRKSDVIFFQYTPRNASGHQNLYAALKESLFLFIFLRESSSQGSLAPLSLSFAAAKLVDLDVEFASTIR